MFDLRYHVASLAAVFLALVIGILVGIAIADRGVREDALRAEVVEEQGLRETAEERLALLTRQQEAQRNYVEDTYEPLMAGRLGSKRIATVFVGSVNEDTRASVERSVGDADGRVVSMQALKLPIDRPAIRSALAGRSLLARYSGDDGLEELGHDLGQELAGGDETPLWDVLGRDVVEEQNGTIRRGVDGVVVARTSGPQEAPTAVFLKGFYRGLGDSGIPAVGVERTGASPTAIGVYRRHGLSSVDDVEQPTGRLALALLLAGAEKGRYGLRPTADALLPTPIDPLPAGE